MNFLLIINVFSRYLNPVKMIDEPFDYSTCDELFSDITSEKAMTMNEKLFKKLYDYRLT